MSLLRYDCEIFVVTADGRRYRWESVVAAPDIHRATRVVDEHAQCLYPACRIVALSLDEMEADHPLSYVETPNEGVFAVNDLSEMVRHVRRPIARRIRDWFAGWR